MSKKTQRAKKIFRNRLEQQLRRDGLPDFRTMASLLRQAANGDEQAAQTLDRLFPNWRKMTGGTRVDVGDNGE